MYEILEYLICALSVLLCAGLLFAVGIAIMLFQEGARALGEVTRRNLHVIVRLKERGAFRSVKDTMVFWISPARSFEDVRNSE